MRAHILPGTRMMSDKWKVYDRLQNGGSDVHLTVMSELVKPKLRRLSHRGLPRTGTTKELFESCLQAGVDVASAL